jgi:hypothetical protein
VTGHQGDAHDQGFDLAPVKADRSIGQEDVGKPALPGQSLGSAWLPAHPCVKVFGVNKHVVHLPVNSWGAARRDLLLTGFATFAQVLASALDPSLNHLEAEPDGFPAQDDFPGNTILGEQSKNRARAEAEHLCQHSDGN